MLLHIPLFCPCKVAKKIDFIHTDSCSYLFGKEPSIFLGALTRAELNWLQSGVKARPAFSFTSLAHCSVHFAPPCLHRSAQHRSAVFRAGPDRLLRMCEKDLGENICNQGINALRTSPSPLILQEAPRGLGRAEQRWRNVGATLASARDCEGGPTWRQGFGGLRRHAPFLRFFASYLRQAPKFRLQPPRHIVSPALRQAATAAARLKLILWDVIASSI